jgi:hypothetical protein
MKKVINSSSFLCLLFISALSIPFQSCQSELKNIDAPSIENRIAADTDFNSLVDNLLTISTGYADNLSKLSASEKKSTVQRLKGFHSLGESSGDMTEEQYSEAGRLMGYKNNGGFLKDLIEINRLKQLIIKKFPELSTNRLLVEKAVQNSLAFKKFSASPNAKVAGGNCRGVYNACLGVAAAAGVVAVALCGPAAPLCVYGATILVGAGMELCRQEAIACYQE